MVERRIVQCSTTIDDWLIDWLIDWLWTHNTRPRVDREQSSASRKMDALYVNEPVLYPSSSNVLRRTSNRYIFCREKSRLAIYNNTSTSSLYSLRRRRGKLLSNCWSGVALTLLYLQTWKQQHQDSRLFCMPTVCKSDERDLKKTTKPYPTYTVLDVVLVCSKLLASTSTSC